MIQLAILQIREVQTINSFWSIIAITETVTAFLVACESNYCQFVRSGTPETKKVVVFRLYEPETTKGLNISVWTVDRDSAMCSLYFNILISKVIIPSFTKY